MSFDASDTLSHELACSFAIMRLLYLYDWMKCAKGELARGVWVFISFVLQGVSF